MILERDSLVLRGCIKKGEHVKADMFPLLLFLGRGDRCKMFCACNYGMLGIRS